MTITETLRDAAHKLQPKKITCAADKSLGRLEAEILLAHALKKDRVWLLTHAHDKLTTSSTKRFGLLIRRRTQHEPVAYILGYKEFYGRRFAVTKDVLIPRPETELMIEIVKSLPLGKGEIKRGSGRQAVRPPLDPLLAKEGRTIWDVGTGSGAIALTLAKEIPDAKILATDVSTRALTIARKNSKLLDAKNVTFLKSDLLQPSAYRWLKRHTDRTGRLANAPTLTICANLPYLPISDAKKIDVDVAKFEPKRALYSGKDGLDLITRFLGQLSRHLPEWKATSSTILIEFDPPQAVSLKRLAKKLFPQAIVTIYKDLAGRNRVLKITSR